MALKKLSKSYGTSYAGLQASRQVDTYGGRMEQAYRKLVPA